MSDDLTKDEKDRALRLDCSIGIATMLVMTRAIQEAKSQRDFEVLMRGVLGFTATSILSLHKVSQTTVLPHDQMIAAMRAWWETRGQAMMLETFEAELRRMASSRDATTEEVEAMFSVKH